MGKYNVQGQLYAQGKYMTAYEAVQEGLGKKVEIRILAQRAAEGSAELSRFQAQIKNLATLDHPSILRVLDSGVANGKLYYVTELKARLTIGELMAQTPPPPIDERVKIGVQLASALKYMHGKGVIHRGIDETSVNYDTEVQNAYVSQFTFIKNSKKDNLTVRGIGTVFQLLTTPEGAMGQALDERSDVFLLGVLLFKMLSGQEPFGPKAFLGLTPETAATIEPKKLREFDATAPESLEVALQKACAVLPDKRYQTSADLHDALLDVQKKLKLPKRADRKDGPPSTGAPLVDPTPAQPQPAVQPIGQRSMIAQRSARKGIAKAPSTPANQVVDPTANEAVVQPEGAAPPPAELPKGLPPQLAALLAQLKEDPKKMKIAIAVAALAALGVLATLFLLIS
jgi:serine/threonine protein kinase